MTLIIDASVVAKWVLSEAGEKAAEALLLGENERVAPGFLLVEAEQEQTQVVTANAIHQQASGDIL